MTSSSNSSEEVILTLSPPRATITLNRPERGNSLSPKLQSFFLDYLKQISNDDLIHYLVLTGNGKFFCTGMDLGSEAGAAEGGVDKDEIFERAKDFFQEVEMFEKPIIGLANGPSYGGGVGLFFLTDIRLCPISTTFTLTEVKRGLVAATISPTIIREWGIPLSRVAMLTSKPIEAKTLENLGSVITFKDGDSEKELEKYCQLIEKCGPNALVRSKKLITTQGFTGLNLLDDLSKDVYIDEKGNGKEKRNQRESLAFKEIKESFQEMMVPSEEALEGIMTFRKSKGKEDVDWLKFYEVKKRQREEKEKSNKSKAKL